MKLFTLSALTLATVASSLTFTSCKKDNDDPKPKTKTDLLLAKKWRITADVVSYTNAGTTVTEDDYANYEACEKDDFKKFEANKVVKLDEGAIRCGNNPQSQTGTWEFTANESKISLSDPDFPSLIISYDVVELTESTLKLRLGGTVSGTSFTQTITHSAF